MSIRSGWRRSQTRKIVRKWSVSLVAFALAFGATAVLVFPTPAQGFSEAMCGEGNAIGVATTLTTLDDHLGAPTKAAALAKAGLKGLTSNAQRMNFDRLEGLPDFAADLNPLRNADGDVVAAFEFSRTPNGGFIVTGEYYCHEGIADIPRAKGLSGSFYDEFYFPERVARTPGKDAPADPTRELQDGNRLEPGFRPEGSGR